MINFKLIYICIFFTFFFLYIKNYCIIKDWYFIYFIWNMWIEFFIIFLQSWFISIIFYIEKKKKKKKKKLS